MSARHPKVRRKPVRSSKTDIPGSSSRSWHRFVERLREKESRALSPVADSAPEFRSDEMGELLQSFPSEEIQFLRFFYVQEMSLEKIGQTMGVAVAQVHLLRARSKTRFQEWVNSRGQAKPNSDRTPTPEVISLSRDLQKLQTPALMRALEVFGAPHRALAWLEQPNPALGGISPLEAVLYQDSRTEVFNILGRIEHGVLS